MGAVWLERGGEGVNGVDDSMCGEPARAGVAIVVSPRRTLGTMNFGSARLARARLRTSARLAAGVAAASSSSSEGGGTGDGTRTTGGMARSMVSHLSVDATEAPSEPPVPGVWK